VNKLLSVEQVIAMWPEPRPTGRALKHLAKAHACCRKPGRSIGFTEADVERDQGAKNFKESPSRLDAAKQLAQKNGCKFEQLFLTMGIYVEVHGRGLRFRFP
jgi:hypothetical protein